MTENTMRDYENVMVNMTTKVESPCVPYISISEANYFKLISEIEALKESNENWKDGYERLKAEQTPASQDSHVAVIVSDEDEYGEVTYWADVDSEALEEGRCEVGNKLYTRLAPPQPQSVADALEAAAKIAYDLDSGKGREAEIERTIRALIK